MQTQRVEEHRYTYGDYVQWTGDERWELIDGQAHLMSPAPNRFHQRVLVLLVRQMWDQLEPNGCQVYVAPFDVRFPKGNEADDDVDTVLQPDLSVFCGTSKLDKAGARGAPDWIIEILSPSTSSRDRQIKRDVYEHHGVAEYWIVDIDGRSVITHQLTAQGRYEIAETAASGSSVPGRFPDVTIDWEAVFADLD